MVPEKDNKLLKITWPEMPSASGKWRSKPLNYISHVVGHEGPNSLLSELIKQGLATSLSSAEKSRLNQQKGGMGISIGLTEKGVAEY